MSLPQLLAGCVVLVTGDRRAGDLRAALERRGARVVHTPALTIVPHTADAELVERTRALLAAPPDVVVVTTAIGFRGWVEAADAAGLGEELHDVLDATRIIARGPKARGAIQAAGHDADWVAESETSAEIRDFLITEGVAGQRIAVQHHGAGCEELDVDLAAAGASVTPLVVYRWGPPPDADAVTCGVQQAAVGELVEARNRHVVALAQPDRLADLEGRVLVGDDGDGQLADAQVHGPVQGVDGVQKIVRLFEYID